MATIKSFTDLEQSRRLAKFLPLESADMHYNDWSYDFLEGYEHTGRYKVDLGTPKTICGELDIPCWSLAALLGVLPKSLIYTPNPTLDGYCCKNIMHDFETYGENPVDACYEMILKLYERV